MAAVVQRTALANLAEASKSDDHDRFHGAVRVVKDLGSVINSSAIKLRLSTQATVDRKSGILDEKEPKADHLLGGHLRPVGERDD
jgi:hypothetical protein